jgi:prepilin peptidase CpaA
MNTGAIQLYGAAVALGLLACLTDSMWRRVPNVLTLGAAVLAVVTRFVVEGWSGIGWSVAGWSVGLLILLPLFALRGMGGGDVKLLAAFGAWLGPRLVAWTGLYGAIAGGVLAVAVTLWHGSFRRTLANVLLLAMHWRVAGLRPVEGLTLETSHSPKLPYAIPLTVGLVVALWLEG